jgi:hypothetical protein
MCNIKYNSPTFFNLEFFPCIALLHVWNRKLVFSHLYIYVLRMWKAHLFAHFHPVYIVPRKQNNQSFESPLVPLTPFAISICHSFIPYFANSIRNTKDSGWKENDSIHSISIPRFCLKFFMVLLVFCFSSFEFRSLRVQLLFSFVLRMRTTKRNLSHELFVK